LLRIAGCDVDVVDLRRAWPSEVRTSLPPAGSIHGVAMFDAALVTPTSVVSQRRG
jgi:hypothetical protein